MKKLTFYISIIVLFFSAENLYAQRPLVDITIENPYFEEIDLDEIRDFQKYASQNFKPNRWNFSIVKIVENQFVKYYRFKGTKDIISVRIGADENWRNWVNTAIETYAAGMETHVEDLELDAGRGVIQMFDEKNGPSCFAYYQNKEAGVTLQFRLITVEDNETRLRQLRLILRELKVK